MLKRRRVREKRHRLPRTAYRGRVVVVFTAVIAERQPVFRRGDVVETSIRLLRETTGSKRCVVPVYYFMPDHLHVMLMGLDNTSDTWAAMTAFKQKSGYLFGRKKYPFRWQKDFYDHVIRENEDWRSHVRYVAANPVRAGLVRTWDEYPFTGAIHVNLDEIMRQAL